MSHNASQFYNPDINNRSTYDVIDAVCDNLERAGFTITERNDFSFPDCMMVTLEGAYSDNADAPVLMDIHCNAEHGVIDGICTILDDEEETRDVTATLNLKELCDEYIAAFGSCEPSAVVSDIVAFLENNV